MRREVVILFVLAACGGSGGSSPDAARADGLIDSSPDATPTGLVSVTVLEAGQPVAGAAVVFSDPDGHVVSTSTTGPDGKAAETLAAGSSVTCDPTFGTGTTHALLTIFDVQPGDQLVMGDPVMPSPAASPEGTVQVGVSAVTNAVSYAIDLGGCTATSSNPGTIAVTLTTACLNSAGTYDALALALGADGSAISYAVALSETAPGGANTGGLTMPAWRTDFATHTITVSNAPASTPISSFFVLDHDAARFASIPLPSYTSSATGTATMTMRYPKQLGTWADEAVVVEQPAGSSGQPFRMYLASTPIGNIQDETADFAAPPKITGTELFVAPNDSTPTISWDSPGSFTGTTGGLVEVRWHSATDSWIWSAVVAPGATNRVRFPDLPAALAVDRTPSTQVFDSGAVEFLQGTMFADETALRTDWTQAVQQTSGTYAERYSGLF
jgi:hypothetical protein